MLDHFQQAAGQLELPGCPTCHIGMGWFRSVRVSDVTGTRTAHFFQCSNCNALQEKKASAEIADRAGDRRLPPQGQDLRSPEVRQP